jgi:hypothetical protein
LLKISKIQAKKLIYLNKNENFLKLSFLFLPPLFFIKDWKKIQFFDSQPMKFIFTFLKKDSFLNLGLISEDV